MGAPLAQQVFQRPTKAEPGLFDVKKLAVHYSPFAHEPPWRANAMEKLVVEAVLRALVDNRLEAECWSDPQSQRYDEAWSIERHAERIAYLVAHGWDEPIELEFWDRGGGAEPYITDGNHRFAAALVLQLPAIDAYYSGRVIEARKFLWTS